ncbi:hypothetical protein L1887_12042 [Cichorium endivia]|nr:hypothetical protein L1887_12042 [Cichorium endivia]
MATQKHTKKKAKTMIGELGFANLSNDTLKHDIFIVYYIFPLSQFLIGNLHMHKKMNKTRNVFWVKPLGSQRLVYSLTSLAIIFQMCVTLDDGWIKTTSREMEVRPEEAETVAGGSFASDLDTTLNKDRCWSVMGGPARRGGDGCWLAVVNNGWNFRC